jgi:putative methyltransferase (TIGR04325 family)
MLPRMNSVATRIRNRVKSLPLVRDQLKRRRIAGFLSPDGFATYYGVFGSFEEARRFLPPSPEFDQLDTAQAYEHERMHRVFCYDYPVMHWLGEAFRAGARSVYDIGGSIGVHYFAYRRYLRYPAALTWEICETPRVVKAGREIARREEAPGLSFTDALDPSRVRADVWISAGALQYIENGYLGELLAACPHPPAYVIVNKLPLYVGDDFVTTQNVGPRMFAPVHVYNRARFIRAAEAAGFGLADAWDVPERELRLPGHPERSFPRFSGLCLHQMKDA